MEIAVGFAGIGRFFAGFAGCGIAATGADEPSEGSARRDENAGDDGRAEGADGVRGVLDSGENAGVRGGTAGFLGAGVSGWLLAVIGVVFIVWVLRSDWSVSGLDDEVAILIFDELLVSFEIVFETFVATEVTTGDDGLGGRNAIENRLVRSGTEGAARDSEALEVAASGAGGGAAVFGEDCTLSAFVGAGFDFDVDSASIRLTVFNLDGRAVRGHAAAGRFLGVVGAGGFQGRVFEDEFAGFQPERGGAGQSCAV